MAARVPPGLREAPMEQHREALVRMEREECMEAEVPEAILI